MNEIVKAAKAARRRLLAAQFLQLLCLAIFWGGLTAAALVATHRWVSSLPRWVWVALPGMMLLAAALGVLLRRPSLRTAALALDRARGLEERLSTALYVREEPSPAAQAVRRDAQAALQRAGKGSIAFDCPRLRRLLVPLVLLLVLLLLPVSRETRAGHGDRDPTGQSLLVPQPVRKEQSRALRRRAFQLEKRARELNRPELKELADAMRKVASELRKEETTKNEALAKLSTLEEKLQSRKEELAENFSESLLKRLREGGAGETATDEERLGENVRRLRELARTLKSLRERIHSDETAADKAQELRRMLESLARNLEEQFGDTDALDEQALSDFFDRLQESLDCEDFAGQEAWDRWLGQADELLGELEWWLGELELLELMEVELAELLACKGCFSELGEACRLCGASLLPGTGRCPWCRGLGGGAGRGVGPGSGFGRGPGPGPKGEAHPEDETVPSKVKGPLSPGEIIGAIRFKTLPEKGELKTSYTEAYRHLAGEAAEALQQQEIPPGYRLHVRDYFDSIRPDREGE